MNLKLFLYFYQVIYHMHDYIFKKDLMVLNKWLVVILSCIALTACEGERKNNSQASAVTEQHRVKLLNVSYDVMRDFYKDYNPLFVKYYQQKQPDIELEIQQSHGGSSKQALSVANGLQADVVTMNQNSDIELLQKKGLVADNWQSLLPNQAVPFTSTTVFLVRKGNPKNIHDWQDLAKDGVQVVMPNPKTSGNGRYSFLAAYAAGLKNADGNHEQAKVFTQKLLANVAVLEAGGRGATTTFVQRQIGDILITFENEANLAVKQFGDGEFELVYPSYSIAAENPVAVVQTVVDKKGTATIAHDYLAYLWSDEAQTLAADLYLRPSNPDVLAKFADRFPSIETFKANEIFGSWDDIMKTYFADGGVFDQVNKR